MTIELKTNFFTKAIFEDDKVTIGKNEIPYENISAFEIKSKPRLRGKGEIFLIEDGKVKYFAFRAKEFDKIKEINSILRDKINSNNDLSKWKLDTPEDLYNYAKYRGFVQGATKKWFVAHFDALLKIVSENEKRLYPFVAIFDYISATNNKGSACFLVTDEKIYAIYQHLLRFNVYSIKLKDIDKILITPSPARSIITIATEDSAYNIALETESAKPLFRELKKITDNGL
ncbi:MAG: hypothetical protein Q4B36_07585 [Tissierellia bacterium]|nr:hypothetical protein [Tissierellia bacterium]